jgi:hypothetical protein
MHTFWLENLKGRNHFEVTRVEESKYNIKMNGKELA